MAYRIRFGDRLRAVRAAAGLSQEALALNTGISRRYMSGMERGEANPTLDQLVRLAVGTGVQPADLLPHLVDGPAEPS